MNTHIRLAKEMTSWLSLSIEAEKVYLHNYWGYQNTIYIFWKLIFPRFYTGFLQVFNVTTAGYTIHTQKIIQFLPNATKYSAVDGCQGFSYSRLQIIHVPGKGMYVHEAFHIPTVLEVT